MELSNITKKYWKDEDWIDLKGAESIKDLYKIASKILQRMPKPIIQVCGPISTGGKGSIPDNLEVFNRKIKDLQDRGLIVFDQMPFEEPMHKMIMVNSEREYFEDILTDFYLPLFESGNIKELHFLSGWKSSRGAMWEHEQAKRLKIKIIYN